MTSIPAAVAKKRPSHKKEIKDSMSLELSRRLENAAFAPARVFVSSNTNDFAASTTSSFVHPDIQDEFAAVGLEYFTSLRAALGIQAQGRLPRRRVTYRPGDQTGAIV